MKKVRRKIPSKIEAEVLFRSNMLCCVDGKRGDHIHHINGDTSNFNFENLAFLCFECHNNASVTGSLRKRLTPDAIRKFREHHYNVIAKNREHAIKKLNTPISKITSEDLLLAAKNAMIILKLEDIKEQYHAAETAEVELILSQLYKYADHNNARVAYEILMFLQHVAYQTRLHRSSSIALQIQWLVGSFFPSFDVKNRSKNLLETGTICCYIAHTIIYDGCIHVKDLSIARHGLDILKGVYIEAKRGKSQKLRQLVLEIYDKLEQHLDRKERNDLENAKRLLKIFKEDLNVPNFASPPLPPDLMKLL